MRLVCVEWNVESELDQSVIALMSACTDSDGIIELTSQGRIKWEGANWAVAQGPPQLRGLHKNSF